MNVIKKIVMSLAMALSMAAISSSAFAEAKGEAEVKAAAEGTIAKIEEAVSLVEKGGDKEAAVSAINEARQLQKEFRFEKTERLRQKANDKLRVAREALDNGETKSTEESLKTSLATFKEMKATYDLTHN